jgi:glycine betaine/choline ABC-type transport system substrate-binding protein
MFKKNLIVVTLLIVLVTSLVGCSSTTDDTITIASKPHAEQYILAEMLKTLVEDNTDLTVELKLGIGGGTANIQPAMEKGEIDVYPEYTGTGWLFVLKEELINDPDELYTEVKQQYEEEYNIIWLDRYGFNNTYALAVREEIAEEYNLETYSDLSEVDTELIFGAEYDFYERDDGYDALAEVYDFDFKDTKEIDIGLKYEAIGNDSVDVINAFSTDGKLEEYNLKVLEDDQNFFPSYQSATLIRGEVLAQHPELEEIFNQLSNQISNDEMKRLNYLVEVEKQQASDVANEFLEEKGLK